MKAAKTAARKGKQAMTKTIKRTTGRIAAQLAQKRTINLDELAAIGDLPCGKPMK